MASKNVSLLEVEKISKRFGGIQAIKDVSFCINEGEILGLIGPNGAGKTTTFNLISGRFPLSSGCIKFAGTQISGMRPDQIAALGIARTFQGARVFPKLTVAENIQTVCSTRIKVGFWEEWLALDRARAADRKIREQVQEILDFVGLSSLATNTADSLVYGHQSLLGIALALSLTPRLLLLDEPFAGMNPQETAAAANMVRRIRATGVTVLLVEHDMPAVMGICDRIVVMDQGTKIVEGTPNEIRNDSRVIDAYLGIDEYA